MSEAEKSAEPVRRAAEREHAEPVSDRDRRQSDSESAQAHPVPTDRDLGKGHSPAKEDGRDKPVEAEADKDIKEGGGLEGAARRQRGHS